MKELFEKLKDFSEIMVFNPPISEEEKEAFKDVIPAPLMSLYDLFNGGEIFVPGTVIYAADNSSEGIQQVNAKLKQIFDIPESYLVFAKLNFGDFICIDTEEPFDVVQWDHEADSPFYGWNSINDWLSESIQDYIDYNDGGDLND